MEGISDIRIVGIDEKRPPRVRKEPYIDVFFRLSHQAPEQWCEGFNNLARKLDPQVKIDPGGGLFIDAYVRNMDHIPARLEEIKRLIVTCNEQYIENIRQRDLKAAAKIAANAGDEGEQGRLNRIVAGLDFDS